MSPAGARALASALCAELAPLRDGDSRLLREPPYRASGNGVMVRPLVPASTGILMRRSPTSTSPDDLASLVSEVRPADVIEVARRMERESVPVVLAMDEEAWKSFRKTFRPVYHFGAHHFVNNNLYLSTLLADNNDELILEAERRNIQDLRSMTAEQLQRGTSGLHPSPEEVREADGAPQPGETLQIAATAHYLDALSQEAVWQLAQEISKARLSLEPLALLASPPELMTGSVFHRKDDTYMTSYHIKDRTVTTLLTYAMRDTGTFVKGKVVSEVTPQSKSILLGQGEGKYESIVDRMSVEVTGEEENDVIINFINLVRESFVRIDRDGSVFTYYDERIRAPRLRRAREGTYLLSPCKKGDVEKRKETAMLYTYTEEKLTGILTLTQAQPNDLRPIVSSTVGHQYCHTHGGQRRHYYSALNVVHISIGDHESFARRLAATEVASYTLVDLGTHIDGSGPFAIRLVCELDDEGAAPYSTYWGFEPYRKNDPITIGTHIWRKRMAEKDLRSHLLKGSAQPATRFTRASAAREPPSPALLSSVLPFPYVVTQGQGKYVLGHDQSGNRMYVPRNLPRTQFAYVWADEDPLEESIEVEEGGKTEPIVNPIDGLLARTSASDIVAAYASKSNIRDDPIGARACFHAHRKLTENRSPAEPVTASPSASRVLVLYRGATLLCYSAFLAPFSSDGLARFLIEKRREPREGPLKKAVSFLGFHASDEDGDGGQPTRVLFTLSTGTFPLAAPPKFRGAVDAASVSRACRAFGAQSLANEFRVPVVIRARRDLIVWPAPATSRPRLVEGSLTSFVASQNTTAEFYGDMRLALEGVVGTTLPEGDVRELMERVGEKWRVRFVDVDQLPPEGESGGDDDTLLYKRRGETLHPWRDEKGRATLLSGAEAARPRPRALSPLARWWARGA